MGVPGLLVLVTIAYSVQAFVDTSQNHHDTNNGCVIDLHCEECLPEYMPLVRSPPVRNGSVVVAEKAVAKLWCGAGYFVQYPQTAEISATCEGGAWRVSNEESVRRLHELGCQESVFEDVLHEVPECSAPYQGRAWGVAGGSHLALACFDPDRAVAIRVQLTPHNKHRDRSLPLSLLGNFQHMFDARTRHDAERLFGDTEMLNRRAKARLAHVRPNLASQSLVATPVIHSSYLKDEHTPVARVASNLVATWRSVAEGNLHAMHLDVASALRSSGSLVAWAGTSGEWRWRGAEPLRLGSAGRFPIPRFHWTVLLEPTSGRALALVVLNDPFVPVSDIREAVFCESSCSRVSWLNHLLRDRAYETPLYGLAFCCEVHEFASRVPEMPPALLTKVPRTKGNLLLNIGNPNNFV